MSLPLVVGERLVRPRGTSPVVVKALPAQVLALVPGVGFTSLALVEVVRASAVSMVVGDRGPHLMGGLLARKL